MVLPLTASTRPAATERVDEEQTDRLHRAAFRTACARFYGRAATAKLLRAAAAAARRRRGRETPLTDRDMKSSGALAVLVPCRFCWRWQHLNRPWRAGRGLPLSLIMATAAADPAKRSA